MTHPVILTRGLSRRFGQVDAVRALDLEVRAGEIFGFLGHNGAGKTTTIRLLNGILKATSGEATVLGMSPWADGPRLRRRTGTLPEQPAVDERLTAHQNLAFWAAVTGLGREEARRRTGALIQAFGLEQWAHTRAAQFSRGMKQRLALARTLLHDPELLFLDEPTTGLDPVSTRQVHELIRRLSREEGRTVFMCTHNLAEAQALCDRVAVLEHGRVIAVGTPSELARHMGRAVRWRIETEPQAASSVCEILRRFGFSPSVEGERWVALSGDARDAMPRIVQTLAAADLPVYQIVRQEPTLEDAYFALHQRDEEANHEP
ncbi:MAG: ABC transporter ATP-binding protein [Anaerolineae bacterium]